MDRIANNIFSTVTYPPFHLVAESVISPSFFDRNAFNSSSPYVVSIDNNSILLTPQQWASYGKDLTSAYAANPTYVSLLDLHTSSPLFDGQAIPLPFVTNDIDGELRQPLNPDIGADEFVIDSLQYFDLELLSILSPDTTICTNSDSLRLRIVNHSSFAIDSFKVETVSYNYSYGIQAFTVHIPAYDTIDLTTEAYTFIPNTGYQLTFLLSEPNGETDDVFYNDDKTVGYTFLESVTIHEHYDPFCDTRELYIDEFPLSTILWSTGAEEDRIQVSAPGTYTVTVTATNGCQVTGTIQIN